MTPETSGWYRSIMPSFAWWYGSPKSDSPEPPPSSLPKDTDLGLERLPTDVESNPWDKVVSSDDDPLLLLEAWIAEDESRRARIDNDGACSLSGVTCWEVALWGHSEERGTGFAAAIKRESERGLVIVSELGPRELEGEPPPNVLYLGRPDEARVGLGRTIVAAIKRANELGL